jgi:hypothetical protein
VNEGGLPRLFETLATLTRLGVRFVLIGGYAAIVRGSPVLTGDIDICYARDDENLGRLASALRELRATPRGAPAGLPFQLDEQTLKAGDSFTFSTKLGDLDIIGTPAGTDGYPQLEANAEDVEVDGMTVRVASLDDLMRMKRSAGRPKDLIQLEWLAALRDETEKVDG